MTNFSSHEVGDDQKSGSSAEIELLLECMDHLKKAKLNTDVQQPNEQKMQKDFFEVHNDCDDITSTTSGKIMIKILFFKEKAKTMSLFISDCYRKICSVHFLHYLTVIFLEKKEASLPENGSENNCMDKKSIQNCHDASSLYTFNSRFGYVDFAQRAQDGFARTHKIHVSS